MVTLASRSAISHAAEEPSFKVVSRDPTSRFFDRAGSGDGPGLFAFNPAGEIAFFCPRVGATPGRHPAGLIYLEIWNLHKRLVQLRSS
jgi:hypothetical protein